MDVATQQALIERITTHRTAGRGTDDADGVLRVPVDTYTDLAQLERDTEDFATAAGIQRGYRTRAQEHVVFGRNEPALQHFHRSIEHLIG